LLSRDIVVSDCHTAKVLILNIQVEKFVDFFLRSIGSEGIPKRSRNVKASKNQQAVVNIGGMRVAAVLHQYTCIPSPPIACSPEIT